MNLISRSDLLTFSDVELLHAEEVLKKYGVQRFSNNDYYSNIVIGKEYSISDKDVAYKKLRHLECTFNNIHFEGTDATGSVLVDCILDGCIIKNADFARSDFTQSKFVSTNSKNEITNTSFSDSNFTSCVMKKNYFEGCSFTNTKFEDAYISDCEFCCCNFESAEFHNIKLENLDLTTTGIDFVEFDNVQIKNVTFSLWGILWSFGGLEVVRKFLNEIKIGIPESTECLSGRDFLELLKEIEAHFYYKKDYFSLANINIFQGNQENAYIYIKEGIMHNLYIKNFKMIRYLCKLASQNHFFTKEQLSQLYFALQSDKILQKMTSYEYKNYLYEMNVIKELLIDNPFGLPQITLKISTDIENSERTELEHLLFYIDKMLEINTPHSNHVVTIRHNSPFFLEVINSDSLNSIYYFALNFLLGIWGNIPQINALILSIVNAKNLLNGKKNVNKELKQQELELKKLELKNLQLSNELLIAEKENSSLQKELLELELQRKKAEENTIFNDDITDDILENYQPNLTISEELINRILKISFSVRYNGLLPSQLREISIKSPQ